MPNYKKSSPGADSVLHYDRVEAVYKAVTMYHLKVGVIMKGRLKNRGNTVVEATLIIPVFLFGMLAVYHMIMSRLAEQIVYEAASETAEYLAEYAYLEIDSSLLPYIKFREYVDDEELVNRYISNGVNGVTFFGYFGIDAEDNICLYVQYEVAFQVPFIPSFTSKHTYCIKQHAYVGDRAVWDREDMNAEEIYVFITDNKEAYHTSRSCTHLRLSVHVASKTSAVAAHYTPCEFCGKTKEGELVYITDEGNRYHNCPDCSGLKRTIYRVKKSSVGGLPQCLRCAGET